MKKTLSRSLAVALVALAANACFKESYVMEPPTMALEVTKLDAQPYAVSFAARVANWDGVSAIQYRAAACAPSGEAFLCFGGPFFESAAMADRVVQPITWSEEQCGLLLVFQATLPNGDEGEASHVTCS